MKTILVIIALFMTLLAPLHGAAAQDTIAGARELYAAASYDDALALLDRLGTPASLDEKLAINQYRALCLLALGRQAEAENAIEAAVATDPLFRPSQGDVSPRLRSVFSTVRQRVLPDMVQQEYVRAKNKYDRQEFAEAAEGFQRVLLVLEDPDLGGAAGRPPLSDLRTLAGGFRDLSAKAAEPPPAPEPAPTPEPVVQLPPPPPVKSVYGNGDPGVVAPGIIRQQLPPFPREIPTGRTGVLEVIVNEFGDVESAVMRSPINPRYDPLVLNAARSWRYSPATLDGLPVKYRKLISIALKPNP
jgi:tetratricopeptide (TPR) repeat protein